MYGRTWVWHPVAQLLEHLTNVQTDRGVTPSSSVVRASDQPLSYWVSHPSPSIHWSDALSVRTDMGVTCIRPMYGWRWVWLAVLVVVKINSQYFERKAYECPRCPNQIGTCVVLNFYLLYFSLHGFITETDVHTKEWRIPADHYTKLNCTWWGRTHHNLEIWIDITEQ